MRYLQNLRIIPLNQRIPAHGQLTGRLVGAAVAVTLSILCTSLPAKADQVFTFCGSVDAGGDTADEPSAQTAAIESTVYQVSCPSTPADGGTVSAAAQGQLSTGVFGATATIGGPVAEEGFGTDLASGVLMSYYFDTPGITSGTAVFDVTLDPTLSATGRGLAFLYVVPGTGITAPQLLNGNTAFDITSPGPITIPFSVPITDGTSGLGANIRFDFEIDSSVNCYSGTGGCSATADFLDPAVISGVTIYDANGNVVPDETLTSQGGFTVPETPSATTPEPTSLILAGTGLFILAGFTGFRRLQDLRNILLNQEIPAPR